MSQIALLHTVLGATALVTGAAVLARRKGTRTHRAVGRVYAGGLLALCVLSFGLRDSTPFFRGFGPFHIAAVVSFVTVGMGLVSVRRRREGWLADHSVWMAWSYIGLVMATGGHVMRPVFLFLLHDVGLPVVACWVLAIGVVWGVPPLIGSWWIARRQVGWGALAREPEAAQD